MTNITEKQDLNYESDLQLIRSMYEDDSFWDEIFDAKLDFLNNGTDPHSFECVRDEIADSWLKCKALGIRPDSLASGKPLSKSEYKKAKQRGSRLISTTGLSLKNIESVNIENDYVFELLDSEGVSLLQIGNARLHQFAGSSLQWNVNEIGTNAHNLCMYHKKPFVVIGPEHYCFRLHSIIACAAPILDETGTAVGALLLTQPITIDRLTPDGKKVLIHAMSLLSSLAASISAQMQLSTYDSKLIEIESTAQHYEMLSRNLIDVISDGILICNKTGKILYTTPEAAHLLRMPQEELYGMILPDLIDEPKSVDLSAIIEKSGTINIIIEGRKFTLKTTTPRGNNQTADECIITIKEHSERQRLGVSRTKAGEIASITFKDILGNSPQIKKAKHVAARFAATGENILISGESGTGKEYFAQAIHNLNRPDGPFMSINCAAIPPRLIESELFGYESGSFTGAEKGGKPGKIEIADGGTLFLDEIGDMPLELQATLLRVIENKRVMRIGGKAYKQVNFRLVAATNRDIVEMTQSQSFREDLFYRLGVLVIDLPPLRERTGDALFFARYFLNECNLKTGNGIVELSNDAINFVSKFAWPGNVRQLKHAIFAAYYTCENSKITLKDFPVYFKQAAEEGLKAEERPKDSFQHESSSSIKVQDAVTSESKNTASTETPSYSGADLPSLNLKELEAQAISEAMKQADDSIPDAAITLGISKATLYRKLKGTR